MVVFLSAVSGPDNPAKHQDFYRKLGVLHGRTDGSYYLSDADGRLDWSDRGIYTRR